MPLRWDGDERGRGVGDGAQLAPGVGELVAALRTPGWVAEDPDVHLLPHVEAWCERDGRLALAAAHTDERHAYVLDLRWRGERRAVGAARAAVFSLIGSFAESATYVRQRQTAAGLRYEVGTGEVDPDARFDPHGHVVVINLLAP